MEGTLRVILSRGADRMSMSDVCESAGVSRTTFYRYFSTKEELLEALGAYHRRQLRQMMDGAIAKTANPKKRLIAVIEALQFFVDLHRMDRLLLIEPAFAINYMKRQSSFFLTLLQTALAPVFEEFEAQTRVRLDGTLLTQMLLRCAAGTMFHPDGATLRELATTILRAWGSIANEQRSAPRDEKAMRRSRNK
jgi:AcrR family transcriptional regulator